MPNWSEYLAAARSRGSLGLELYCVQSTPLGDGELLRSTLPDHLAYQAKLEAEGALVFAGPLSDESGLLMEGMGMIIYRADSFEAARVRRRRSDARPRRTALRAQALDDQ